MRALLDPAGDADGARDAGAQGHEEEPLRAAAGPGAALGETAGAHVVTHRDRDAAQPLPDQGAQRDVLPAEVRRVDGDAVLGVDQTGDGDADRGGAPAEAGHSLGVQAGGEVEDAVHDGLGAPVPAGGPAVLVQQGAVGADQGGLHARAADIEGDDVIHADQSGGCAAKGLVHLPGLDMP